MTEAPSRNTTRLPGSNATVTSGTDLVTFSFPRTEGVLRSARSEFRDRADLVRFLSDTLGVPIRDGGLRGTVRRHGKYVRHDSSGRVIHTFGDPILDLITDEHGELTIGKQRLAIGAEDLRDSENQIGGTSNVDLGRHSDELLRMDLIRAANGEGGMRVVESTERVVELATIRSRTFVRNGHKMRFRAWKKKVVLYWSMGAEIETWGADFAEARIESRYLDTVVGQTCAAVKIDSDHDTNDDYLDEYEWGVNAPQPLRVVSRCSARWQGENFGPTQVEAGTSCFEVG